MHTSKVFLRIVFAILSTFFFIALTTTMFPFDSTAVNACIGVAFSVIFCFILFWSDSLLKKISLKTLNTITLGLFFGFLLGQTVNYILHGLLSLTSLTLWPETSYLLSSGIFLWSVYYGVTFTLRSSEEFFFCIPFFRIKPTTQKKRDFLLDLSILSDPRLIDLASSGLLDKNVVLPKCVLKEIYAMTESNNENLQSKGRRCLEVVKKLEGLHRLELRHNETDFSEVKDAKQKLVKLARSLNANILTADMSQIDQYSIEGVLVINIHYLAKALKPLTQTGESLSIKVQRYGKEARQGVGYLDDGTMVVINGGAEYIGEIINAQVLSVKHTSSGRMIFCNAMEEDYIDRPHHDSEQAMANVDDATKKYFAL